jgi:hypothetical protein
MDLSDRLALRTLVETYSLAADQRDSDRMAGCFIADGVNCVPKPPDALGPTIERRGRTAIGDAVHVLDRYPATLHAVVGQVIDDSVPGQPTGVVTAIAHHLERRDDTFVDVVWHLRYHDKYCREGSRWYFSRRDLWCDWIEEHLVKHVAGHLMTR